MYMYMYTLYTLYNVYIIFQDLEENNGKLSNL